ncbi:MAG: ABC transporter substrate-binding protein [Bacteriovoracaceae bacterium]|nr:ABC transporter substrate-binding protein [Bacteriovoracaceae bacterium]
MKVRQILGLLIAIFALEVNAAGTLAVGNVNAPQGGEFKMNLEEVPTTLHPLSSSDAYASMVQAYVMESLMERSVDTYEWHPALAKEVVVAKDGMSFEFTLRDGATWHDGKPVTVQDVKFSFDAVTDKTNKYKTAHLLSYYENIKEAKVTGPNKIKFIVGKPYFGNFNVVAGMTIVPKHIYENGGKDLNKKLVGSGAYMLDEFDRAKHIRLKKNPKWWGANDPMRKGQNNFGSILMRFVQDGTIAIQRTENGDFDFIGLTSEEYMKKTSGPKWGKEIAKVKMTNKAPKGYGFIGLNLKNPMFTTAKTRKALSHLFNREEMIKKFLYDMSLPAAGPWYQQSDYADPNVKAPKYDPKLALQMLKEDGWAPGADKVLTKKVGNQNVRLSFTILNPNKEAEKYLTMFKENAKQAGVDVNIKLVEWNAFIKLLDERKFEAVTLAWSGGDVDYDPKQIWHSESMANQGSNFVSYANPKVDKLIDEARITLDKQARVKKLREVYKMIADDAPYIFWFNSKFAFYGVNKRVGRPKDTYNYDTGRGYWWLTK